LFYAVLKLYLLTSIGEHTHNFSGYRTNGFVWSSVVTHNQL